MQIDPKKMDRISKEEFAPIYPLIASQILNETGIKKGICVDIGSGPASLSIALAKITDLKICAMDIKEEMCELAEKNISQEGLIDRIKIIKGDVHHMPFQNSSVDLIVSRGSIPFWKDLNLAFSEIYRVLKSNGASYVGGGFGSRSLKNKIKKKQETKQKFNNESPPKIDVNELKSVINGLKINKYTIKNDDSGLWALIKK